MATYVIDPELLFKHRKCKTFRTHMVCCHDCSILRSLWSSSPPPNQAIVQSGKAEKHYAIHTRAADALYCFATSEVRKSVFSASKRYTTRVCSPAGQEFSDRRLQENIVTHHNNALFFLYRVRDT